MKKNNDKIFLEKTKPDESRRKTKNKNLIFWVMLIFFASVGIGYILSSFFIYNQEILLWMTSTIAQAFGAMLAIITSIALFQIKVISDSLKGEKDSLLKKIGISLDKILYYIEKKKKREEAEDGLKDFEKSEIFFTEIIKKELQQIEDLRNRMSYIILSMAFLVFVSLFILFLSKTFNVFSSESNVLVTISSTFLLFYAGFCLIVLIYEIHAFMDWRRR